jgi:vacuolar-type H+-ATPase subunit E/Vma4
MTAATEAALEPIRQRLRRAAEEQAARLRAAAQAQAEAIVREAHQAAAAVLGAAAAQADSAAAAIRAAELRTAHQRARSAVLAAQRAAHDDLRRRVLAAVSSMPEQAGYAGFLGQLTDLAEQAAGPHAQVTTPPAGGVLARSDGVVVDCSLSRLADLAVASLGAAVRELWSP